MRVRIGSRGQVDCRAQLSSPLSVWSIWGQIRDFDHYARQDFFHAAVAVDGGVPKAGSTLSLSHHMAGIRVRRVGRILWWREGVGYSFSDLSTRGPRRGFPHVFSYRLRPDELAGGCVLDIRVRGLWTAHWIPHSIAKLWLRWVFLDVVLTVENELLAYQLARRRTISTPKTLM